MVHDRIHFCHCFSYTYFFFSKQKLPDVLVPAKVKELERERALKWGKMLRNWEKFQGTDTVCSTSSVLCVTMVCVCIYTYVNKVR